MKIDTSRLKRGNSDVSPECQALIDRLRNCSRIELADELAKIDSWTFGKCELYHWIEVLDIFDGILEEATDIQRSEWHIEIDVNFSPEEVKLVLLVLNFTTLLIEHSFSRHLYSSIEHLSALLLSIDMEIVLGVLNLLYMFSKRSNYLSRLTGETRSALLGRLNFIAESWGGREYGLGLAECCHQDAKLPPTATIFYYEFYNKRGDLETINIDDARGKFSDPRDLTVHLLQRSTDRLSDEQRIHLFMRLRSSMRFHEHQARLQFVQARLQALSVLVYSDAIHEKTHSLIYPGFLEELVELLELNGKDLVEIHAAALRTMTSIIHLDRNPTLPKKPSSRLGMIIDVTGANSYHGFLPTLVRGCICSLTAPQEAFPLPLATALFSFLYHLATYEVGGESLVACGMMESLLKVINWQGSELEHITFVTRAVRVIDLITNIDMASFQAHAGLSSFIGRLEVEVRTCRADQPDEIIPRCRNTENIEGVLGAGGGESGQGGSITESQSGDTAMIDASDSTGETSRIQHQHQHRISSVCLPQRAALLKSMLNFLKKAIQDRAFAESIPHVMEGSLPNSLRHIISNAEYYGPSLFLLATDVVTVYVFQEPSLLSALQDNGLTEVVLQALLQKDVPATREVLGSLPNVFSALCLNGRGLEAFLAYNPFDRLFRVLLSPNYLPAMRRRRSSIGDTATHLGSAVDEFMRHHPRLTVAATAAIVKLLKDLVELGSSGRFMCWRPPAAATSATTSRDAGSGQGSGKKQTPQDAGSSDDEDDDEEEASTASQRYDASAQSASRQQVPLTDYIHNTMKFIDAILSKSNSDDHCREFVNQGGLQPLFQVLALPNLPVDCSVTALAQSVATVCKSIMSLAFEPMVLGIALEHLSEIVERLEPLQRRLEHPGGSVLLGELANCPDPEAAFATPSFTPLLHAISAAHGYIVMLVHVCRTGQNNVRTVSLQKWGQDSEQGLGLLRRLVQLYTALVWESTLLLALCTDDIIPQGCDFGKEDLDRLVRDDTAQGNANGDADADARSNGVTNAMENLTTSGEGGGIMEIDLTQSSTSSDQSIEGIGAGGGSVGSGAAAAAASGASGSGGSDKSGMRKSRTANPTQLRYINVLLSVSSRLGRALAELFGLLVKLCVGSPLRQRRGQTIPTVPPCFAETSREIARVLSFTLVDGLSYDKLPPSPFPKMKFTYLICSIGFTMPMLFDERRYAFHLMLHKFVQEGGLRAFFEVFNWVLTTATPDNELPETTVEFMNEWLTLLERLINPKAILHTPHTLPANQRTGGPSVGGQRDPGDFDVVQYLIEVQRNAFNAIQQLRKIVSIYNFSDRMQEYTLVILRHIFRAEAIIKERQSERQSDDGDENVAGSTGMTSTDIAARIVVGTAPRRTGTSTDAPPPQQPVNPQHLRQLMDMGFSHDHCTAALRQATSVEQATELLLNMPIVTERAPPERNMDVDMGEEEQYIHAILMSLKEMPDNLVEGSTIAADAETEPETPIPLATDELDRWADGAVYICLNIIDTMPTLVSRALDLLITIAKRNGIRWRDDMLDLIVDEVENCLGYYEKYLSKATPRQAFVSLMRNKPISEKTDNRLHLLRLMLDPHQGHDLRFPTAMAVGRANLIHKIFIVMERLDHRLTHFSTEVSGPKWFPHLSIVFRQIEQVAVLLEHRQSIMMRGTWRTWKWYDVATAQWNTFSMVNNRTIDDAFTNGESSVRIRSGRHRFTVNFGCMSQVNEETGAYQPVIMAIERNGGSYVSIGNGGVIGGGPIRGIEQFDVKMILEILIDLLPLSIDTSVKYSLMKTCLRITRNFQYAKYFAQNGGIEALLRMRHVPGNNDFLQIALLLIRHTVEEPKTLELAMESVIVSRLVPNIPAGYRDLIYLTRQLSGAVARCPEMYVRVAKRMLRLDTTSTTARRSATAGGQHDDDEPRLLVKLASTSTGQQSTTSRVYTVEDRVTHDVISALLSALITTDGTTEFGDKSPNPADSDDGDRSSNTAPIPEDDDNDSSMAEDRISHGRSPRWTTNTAQPTTDTQDTNRLLISKGVLLRFLSDLVRSYQTVALIVAEYTIPKGEANLTKDTPLLAYLIDTFIPWTDSNQDRECNASARMLVSSLAAMSGVGRIQSILIHELKSALVRTWHMTDMAKKCFHIQLLAQLIPILIEDSPSEHPMLMTTNGLRQQMMMPRRSKMFYGMVRLNLIEDLARVTQQLDFAHPHAIATLNAVLKPLETLLRLTNQPTLSVVTRRRGGHQQRNTRRTSAPRPAQIIEGGHVDVIVSTVIWPQENGSSDRPAVASSSSSVTTQVSASVGAGGVAGDGGPGAAAGSCRVDGDAGGGVGVGGAGEQAESTPWEEHEEGNDAAWQDLYTMESSSDSEESESAGGEDNAEPADMENEEEEEHEEAEPDEPSDVEVDEETRQFVEMYEQHVYGMRSPTFVEIERGSGGSDVGGPSGSGGGPDTEDINMIQYPRVGVTSGNSNAIDSNDAETPDGAGSSHDIARDTSSPRVYFHAMYDDTGDTGGRGSQITRDGTTAAAPTTAAGNLQLLMGSSTQQNLTPDGTGANGGGGAVAQRNRVRRYHYLRSIAARNTTQPVILQRLLGPSSHPSTSSAPFRDATRVVLMDNGFGIFSPQASGQNEEGAIDVVDRADYSALFGRSLASSLTNTPSVLSAWVEESKLLGLETQPYVCQLSCEEILKELEVHRTADGAKVSAKRKKIPNTERAKGTTTPSIAGNGSCVLGDDDTDGRVDDDGASGNSVPEIRIEDQEENQQQPQILLRTTTAPSSEDSERSETETVEGVGDGGRSGGRGGDGDVGVVGTGERSEGDVNVFHIRRDVGAILPGEVSTSEDESISEEDYGEEAEEEDDEDDEVGEDDETEEESAVAGAVGASTADTGGSGSGENLPSTPPSSVPAPSSLSAPSSLPTPSSGGGNQSQMPLDTLTNLPDGIDPSFLAALPDDMRHEVLEQHLRLQRNREEAQRNAAQRNYQIGEINSEFLAALPPHIQEEVLTQQRIDQQSMANPNDPVDAAAFFQNLPAALRQSILTDMEDSQISVLPPELAAEAQNLRRDWQMMQEHVMNLLSGASSSSSSTVLRYRGRDQAPRSRFRSGWGHSGNLQGLSGGEHSSDGVMPLLGQYSSAMDRQGYAFLDQEALASLLVMLFIDAPKFNVLRFQRVIRNLCFHAPTRRWIIGALLAIMERTAEVVDLASTKKVSSVSPGIDQMESINSIGRGGRGQMSSSSSSTSTDMSFTKKPIERPMWLNIRLDPALGSRANVFIYCNTTKKLLLHPQAANSTCRHALELLTLLAKTFAAYFMPTIKDDAASSDAAATAEAGPSRPAATSGTTFGQQDDFWSILLRLDSPGGRIAPTEPQKRTPGYPTVRTTKQNPVKFTDSEPKTFDEAPFGRLVAMLRAPNIRKSRPLTDKLLRLLAYMSIALPTDGDSDDKKAPSFIKNYSVGILETIVDVLSEKSCSEDGLDNIANLLVNLSHCSTAIRDNLIKLLFNAVKELAQLLEEQIKKLMDELKMADLDAAATATTTAGTSDGGVGASAEEPSRRGTLQDRFTREVVVVSSEGRPRATGDLQLPSIAPLVAKTSNQTFFLRTLKIIFQIRRVEKESENTPVLQFRDINLLRQLRLWRTLSDCLELLKQTHDHHAVLVFQCAVEAFFLTHSPARRPDGTTQENRRDVFQEVMQPMSPIALNLDTGSESDTPQPHNSPSFFRHHAKFLSFAEKHRTVLNQILRQYTTHLADGPFAVLVDHTRILDFDVKRRYFRTELERCDEGIRREELAIHVNRMNVFEDSFRELYRRSPEEWKNRFYIAFEDEEGQDAGGLLREWYVIISREIFNPNYALFTVSPGDRVTYMINPSSHANSNHLCYYKFVGRVIAKAIYDNKLLECYFTRSLYKHILGIRVKYTDMESEDYDFYNGLVYLKENNITTLGCELTFSLEVQEFGVTEIRDLIPNGRNIPVTEENKLEYIRLVCQLKMSGSIKQQLAAFLEGFYDIIPKRLISIFNEQELELLISGLPNVDIEDLRANTEYHKYSPSSIQIQWFWRALRSFDQADRAKFLQFVTGTSKVPLQGFAALEGMNGIQKFQIHRDDRGTDRLPSAHTCFNQLDLPVYKTYDKLRECLYKAIHECSEGFGFA